MNQYFACDVYGYNISGYRCYSWHGQLRRGGKMHSLTSAARNKGGPGLLKTHTLVPVLLEVLSDQSKRFSSTVRGTWLWMGEGGP